MGALSGFCEEARIIGEPELEKDLRFIKSPPSEADKMSSGKASGSAPRGWKLILAEWVKELDRDGQASPPPPPPQLGI